jgi:uncharacterized protein YnzC (UPF0291/DUF896 family)
MFIVITQEQIDRINYLARKAKAEGLTEAEALEQKALRAEYVKAFRSSLESQLESTIIVRPDGTKERITKKPGKRPTGKKPGKKD